MDNNREQNLEKIRELGEKVALGSDNTYSIDVDLVVERGEHYVGTIVFKRPNMNDYLKMGVLKGQLIKKKLGELDLPLDYIDDTIKFVAQMLSSFEVVVVSRPKWFAKPEECVDFDLLYYIYGRYEAWLNNFRADVPIEPDGDSTE